MTTKAKKNQKVTARQVAANVRAIETAAFESDIGASIPSHGQFVAANASQFVEGNFSEALTAYAVGYRDPTDLDAALEFFAPAVPVPRRFDYRTYSNLEEFLSDDELDDDLRAIGADFKQVEYTGEEVSAKTLNRGLRVVIDEDQVDDNTDWRERYTAKLIRRLKRNALRRALALLSASAVNSTKVWDTTAGKDPDMDVILELVAAGDISGIKPNRVGYGETAWSRRMIAHRAQDTAGGIASATLNPQAVAGLLGVEEVHVNGARRQSTASAKAQMLGNLVLMFTAYNGVDTEDPSNIKRFVSSAGAEGQMKVYERQVGTKLWEIAVEHYELTKMTSLLGVRQFTVNAS